MPGIFKPLYFEPIRHVYKMLVDGNYRHYSLLESRMKKIPRYSEKTLRCEGFSLTIPDSASFLSAYKEIFQERIYAFDFESCSPRVLDLGANIGLSVLFFKKMYPNARITAFEADPKIFAYLEKNVHGNGFTDVELINKAVWSENTTLEFSSEGADGGRAALTGDENLITVEAVDIDEFLRGKSFDFLKMDIEGAEEFVLPACRDHLAGIKFVFVEYHSKIGQKQCLDRIMTILAEAGYRIHVHTLAPTPSPFVEIKARGMFDLQLNIFAWRE